MSVWLWLMLPLNLFSYVFIMEFHSAFKTRLLSMVDMCHAKIQASLPSEYRTLLGDMSQDASGSLSIVQTCSGYWGGLCGLRDRSPEPDKAAFNEGGFPEARLR